MSAGLPGLGLGGLLFILSALLAPFRQAWLTARGRGRPGDWPKVGRQFAQAVLMVAAIDLTLRIAYLALTATGLGDAPAADAGTVLPLTLIGITAALLGAVLVAAKLAQMMARTRADGMPRVPAVLPRTAPVRALALGGAAAVAWFALLAGGASRLSPLMEPDEESRAMGGSLGVERIGGAPPPRPRSDVMVAPTARPVSGEEAGGLAAASDGAGLRPELPGGAVSPRTAAPADGAAPDQPAAARPGPGVGQAAPQVPASARPESGTEADPARPPASTGSPPANGRAEEAGPPPTIPPGGGSGAPEEAGPPAHAGGG